MPSEEEKAEHAQYMRDYRARTPLSVANNTKGLTARRRALRKLSQRHRTEYDAMLTIERAKLGLPPTHHHNC